MSYDLPILLGWLTLFGVGLKLLVGWPTAPVLPDHVPSWSVIQVWIQSPGASLDGLLSWAAALAWVVWVWTLASVLLRVAVDVADVLTRGARWVGSVRLVSDWLTIPLVRRAVDASLAGMLLARVVAQSGIAEASPLPQASVAAVQIQAGSVGHPRVLSFASSLGVFDEDADDASDEVTYTVKAGDTLSGIALAYYGDPAQAERIYQANLGRQQPNGRQFNRHGLILPGWTLVIPGATQGIVEEHDGDRWYVVKRGDSLRGIAALQLGDEERYRELFDLNVGVARVGETGPVLQRPELIWPGLQLRLPRDAAPDDTGAGPVNQLLKRQTTRSNLRRPSHCPTPPAASAPDAPGDQEMDLSPRCQQHPRRRMVETSRADRDGADRNSRAAGAHALRDKAGPRPSHPSAFRLNRLRSQARALPRSAVTAAALVVRRRRPAPRPDGPESDVRIEGGFAEADPVEGLARRLARTSDPPRQSPVFSGRPTWRCSPMSFPPDQRREIDGVTLAATRHGRTSTTLVLAAPVPARPHLVRCMRAAAERAFGEHVDVDGLVSRDGDVLVRVTWDPRHPVSGRVLELVGPGAGAALWPTPCLVPLLLLYDRQEFEANWYALSNVLLAAPAGGNVDVPLSALVASLVSAWRPEDLGLVLLAQPHTLPEELGRFPHGLFDTVNSADPAAVQQALMAVRQELDRRMAAGATDEPDLVVVIRELGDLDAAAIGMLKTIAAAGPRHRVRLVVASERPVAEVLQDCPFLDELGTRLVLQTRDEEESVVLLGTPAGEELGSGGHALLRLESRVPIQGWARLVPGDYLARLLSLMGTRDPRATVTLEAQTEPVVDSDLPDEQVEAGSESAESQVEEQFAHRLPLVRMPRRSRPPRGRARLCCSVCEQRRSACVALVLERSGAAIASFSSPIQNSCCCWLPTPITRYSERSTGRHALGGRAILTVTCPPQAPAALAREIRRLAPEVTAEPLP